MNIGIIGAGQIGGTLTRKLSALGHQVFVANSRGGHSLDALTKETGAKAVSVKEAARAGEIVVVTIQEPRIKDLPNDLFEGVSADVVVVDTGNYYPRQRDGAIDEIEAGTLESVWVSKTLGRPVIKAFNNIYAKSLADKGTPAGTPSRVALPVAGDDAKSKQRIMDLINALGFDPVDAGPLSESWRQQPATPVYCADFDVTGVKQALAEARPERQPEWQATPDSPGTFEDPR